MKTILTIVGARPQFVKAAVVSRALRARPGLREILVHTGQHFDANMSDVFFEEMDIPRPDHHLGISGLSHGAMTGRMIEGLERIMQAERPDWVVIYGDTNSTLAGAVAARKLHLPLAHVEAGLRSFDMRMPEEVNRVLADRISDLLLCPTETAVANLQREGYDHLGARVVNCGDVMYDAVLYYLEKARSLSRVLEGLGRERYALCTVHREENVDNPERLTAIFDALEELNERLPVVLPLHPRTGRALEAAGRRPRIRLLPPVGYLDMLELLRACELVLTDSGGLQKEAYFSGKFCVTLRDTTEWVELVEHGFNRLVGSRSQAILDAAAAFEGRPFPQGLALYGDGRAAERVVDELVTGTGGLSRNQVGLGRSRA